MTYNAKKMSVSNPLVSIVIPCYNAEKTIKMCLDSLLKQNIKNWEAICINDGSSDSTSEILEEYKIQDSRIKIYQQANSGAFASRNKGIALSGGKFITFIDSDDSLHPLFLEKSLNCFHRDIDIVSVGVRYIGSWRKYREYNDLKLTYNAYLKGVLTGKYGWELWGKIYRKNLFREVALLPERLNIGEDAYLFIQLVLASRYVRLIDLPLYNYTVSSGSISKCKSAQYAEETLKAATFITDMIEKKNISLSLEKEIGAMNLLFYSNASKRCLFVPNQNLVKKVLKNHLTLESLNLLPFRKKIYIIFLSFLTKLKILAQRSVSLV